MKRCFLLLFALSTSLFNLRAQGWSSIQSFGVLPTNDAKVNRDNLQRAIDSMTERGGALYVEPVEGGYPIDGGVVLRRNVSLIGAHGPTGRGTAVADRSHPTGSLFIIRDREHPFLTVESATQVRGIQFYYPEQTNTDPLAIIPYPSTICMSQTTSVQGVTLSNLTFYGEYFAMDFRSHAPQICEQILFEHCYGYPLSGQFIAIDRCYDVPRILHCHVNPANMREFGRSFRRPVIDAVVGNKTYTYWIDHTDNAQLMDLFTFGVYGGIYLGNETYGQLTNFNFDCVCIGVHKLGSQWKNRNWQIAQGSIIANAGDRLEDVHPILIEGVGHTALSNVEAFSGSNSALTNHGASWDYMTVTGAATVSMTGCRMQGYKAPEPLHLSPNAQVRAVGCLDRDNQLLPVTGIQTQRQSVTSILEVLDIQTGERRVLKEFNYLIEAPNWTRDGRWVYFNSGGLIYKIDAEGIGNARLVDTQFVSKCNNDHVLSFDGKWLAVSSSTNGSTGGGSYIYVLPVGGGTPRLVTPYSPSYLHGWSPDGKRLAYCAFRDNEKEADIYTIPVKGGEEVQLTDAPGLDDGPEYSPDGKYIWFNSVRTGLMQVWRMRADGSEQTQMTFDETRNAWFPHVSPDGKQVIYITYHKGDLEPDQHLANKNVELWLMPSSGGQPRLLTQLFGGQGTINTNSWAPDSRHVAFVSYKLR